MSRVTHSGPGLPMHLTCAPLNRNINILQDSEFISANMFEAKAKLFTKQCKTQTQIIYLVRRYAEIESILHVRAGQGRRLEKMWRSWLSLFGFRCVFILLAVAEGDDNLIGACRVSRVRKN